MVGVHDCAGGFFAEDLGFRGGVEACAEVAAVIGGLVCGGLEDEGGRGGGVGVTCRCS